MRRIGGGGGLAVVAVHLDVNPLACQDGGRVQVTSKVNMDVGKLVEMLDSHEQRSYDASGNDIFILS